MKIKCCVRRCTNTYIGSVSNLSFFAIPKGHPRIEWIAQMRQPELMDAKNPRICAAHFEDKFFKNAKKNRLTDNAVPTLALESEDPEETSSGDEKMLDVSGSSTGSNNPPSGKPHLKLGISEFVDLLGSKDDSYYIDKTGLVEAFFKTGCSRVLVTAPRLFGKTSNISMLHAFFQLQLPVEESKRLSEEDFQQRIKQTNNYKLFHDHDLYITKNSDLITEHFGRYPVISISFKCNEFIQSYDDAIKCWRMRISEAFAQHTYLFSSKALATAEIKACIKWLNREWDVNSDRLEITNGLRTLIWYLYKHFDRKVVVLVDEYDAVVTKAMINAGSKTELELIVNDCAAIITNAVKEDDGQHWVKYAFITGISHISGMGLCDGNITPYKFLEKHNFVPYYGLTEEEMVQLLKITYGFDQQILDDVKSKFSGYISENKKEIYHMRSVLDYARKLYFRP